MGISDGLEGGPNIDCSVGAIVWVRRRNGSWWPGRILGSDELSASHVMSPRSGTPVKLLGREDASVDWYNLEKSKRVKPFRCGEFDDCIEKAESSQSIPPKKREKYARREDAILHALELERQHLGKKHKKFAVPNCTSYKMPMPSTLRKVSGSCILAENYLGNDKMGDHCKFINLKTQPLSKDENISHSKDIQQGRYAKQWNGEGDNSEAVPRMRGLQDFGLRTATSKRKASASVAYGSPPKPFLVDNRGFVLPSVGHDMGTINHANGSKNSSAVKRRRSQSSLTEDSLIKRRDKRRPLVQVLQSTVKLPDVWSLQSDGDAISTAMQGEGQEDVVYQSKRSSSVNLPQSNDCLDHTGFSLDKMQMSPSHIGTDDGLLHPSLLTEENTSSGLIKAQESDSSETDYSNLDMGEEATLLSDPKISGRYVDHGGSALGVPEQPGNVDNEELEETELSSYVSHPHFNEQAATVASDMGGSSNWQSKGKRNIRNLTKRPMEVVEGRGYINRGDKHNGSICGLPYGSRGHMLKTARMGSQSALRQGVYNRREEFNYAYEEGSSIRNDFGPIEMLGYGSRRYPSILKASSQGLGSNITDSDDDFHEMTLSGWEGDQISRAALRGYREESDQCFDLIYDGHLGARMEPMLMDIDLKVQASYQGERVPLVSLMSRLNGKAIIGHPVQIEILEDGSSGHLVSRVGVCEEPADGNGNTALPPVWRTARRTTMHRLRSHPSSAMEGEELDPPQFSDIESKPPLKKPYSSLVSHKERLVKKKPHIGRPPADKKSSKKVSKKISLSSQKTRTLSSLATEQKLSGKNSNHKLAGKIGDLDGAIKSEKTSPPVTCVPVKLVFSRIMEAVGRPPSKAVNHRTLAGGLAERKPL